ncbi:hypothetical protein MMC24_000671 [Lignoscripta atroalba]|nr:hypothetical protein [Lignoscripta atroalba]
MPSDIVPTRSGKNGQEEICVRQVSHQRKALGEASSHNGDNVTTTVLVNNVHCASCVSVIDELLRNLGHGIRDVQVNILSHEVRLQHTTAVAASAICQALDDAAFEVYSATTTDERGRLISELSFADGPDGWLEVAAEILRQPHQMQPRPTSIPHFDGPKREKRKRHVEKCLACQAGEPDEFEKKRPPSTSGSTSIDSDLMTAGGNAIDTNGASWILKEEGQTALKKEPTRMGNSASSSHDAVSGNGQSDSFSAHWQESAQVMGRGIDRLRSDPSSPQWENQSHSLSLSIGGMTCSSCTSSITSALEELDFVASVNVSLMTNSAEVQFSGLENLSKSIVDVVEDIGYEAEVTNCQPIDTRQPRTKVPLSTELKHRAILSIGGMTCVSCSNAITDGLSELSYVESVNVTLMTNSGVVTFAGLEHLEKILEKIDDLGYDCAVERCTPIDLSKHRGGRDTKFPKVQMRSVQLRIEGMFCEHCPPRIIEAIHSTHSAQVTIQDFPNLKAPIIRVSYQPSTPDFTIRDIISTIDSTSASFKTSVYHPPSIEQRSQAMQRHERSRLFRRLIFSFLVAIPTFLIGVVWMSLVPSTNQIRMFFERPVWSGTVTRFEWALFILATPVMFFAADVFHVRAIKEIRVLWRRGSKVPILRRFYRFGSMSLLISAGTSVAYFASLALLIIGATVDTNISSSREFTTYFDTVVFLTFFILIGRYLEAYSKSKTGDAVAMLGNLRPQEALLVISSGLGSPSASEDDKMAAHTSTKTVKVDLLEVGDMVIVPRGSSPPADGVIIKGCTQFDESSLTGESRPVQKVIGDMVFAGAVNVGNPITIEISEIGGTSMLDQIVSVVREGQTKRAPVERVADILTGYFVPVITALAIITFLIWFSLGQSGALSQEYLDVQEGGWAFWSLEFAIAVFVVACPCGIGLAAPTALFVGGGLAAKHGILVRGGGEAFQEASDLDAVVFDKTGTLTEGGDLKVTDYEMLLEENDASIGWSIVKALEEQSTHPIARAILNLASTQPSIPLNADVITEEPGLGVGGTFTISTSLGNITYEAILGSEALITSLGPKAQTQSYFISQRLSLWQSQAKSIALFAVRRLPQPNLHNNQSSSSSSSSVTITTAGEGHTRLTTSWTISAIFATTDPIRPSALPTIQAIQSRGLAVYMLTGDNLSTATAVATALGIPIANVFAGVLPTQKAEKITWLQDHAPRRAENSPSCNHRLLRWLFRSFDKCRNHNHTSAPPSPLQTRSPKHKAKIAFVGDGVNDAPALSTATVSISISHPSTSDIAVSTSSFILLSPSPSPSPSPSSSSSLSSLPILLTLSSRVFTRIKFNFAWALVYNIVLVPVAAGALFWVKEGGWRLGPVWASAAMAGSSVSVVVSSLLLRWEGRGKGQGDDGR